MVDAYRIRAEHFSKSGEEQIAAEYHRLAHEARPDQSGTGHWLLLPLPIFTDLVR